MPIYSPDIRLSKNDVKLIRLLSDLIVPAAKEHQMFVNRNNESGITHEQAYTLLQLLGEKVIEKRFLNKIEFAEKIFSKNLNDRDICQRIYKFERKKNRKSSVMSSAKWSELQARLGAGGAGSFQSSKTMDYGYFLKMEKKLFEKLDLHPAVRNLLITLLRQENEYLAQKQLGNEPFSDRQLIKPITSILNQLELDLEKRKNMISLPTLNLISSLCLITDTTVMFTSRDWTTAGTISGISSFGFSLFANS